MAQSDELSKLSDNYKKELKLPLLAAEVNDRIVVNKTLLNSLLIDKQEMRAKFYSSNGKLVYVTTYGKIPQTPLKWETWTDESHTKRVEKSFDTKAYALGNIAFNKNYHVWITKIVGFQKTYIDMYVFEKNGKLKSLINLYEAEYESNGDTSKIANVYLKSTITGEGTIKWEENRFNVKTTREYKLQPDGYFKVTKQEIEGEYEP
jgi:hypothetical protein